VALALTFLDIEWQPVFVDFFNGEARSPAFRAINAMGEVPVLVDGETTLTQSGVMLDYLSSKSGKLGGKSAAERREVLRWLLYDEEGPQLTAQLELLDLEGRTVAELVRQNGQHEVADWLHARIQEHAAFSSVHKRIR
jgi:glutathione S-transferase